MDGALVAAILVAELVGAFGLGYVWENRILRWYVARARRSKARMALVISASHTTLVAMGLALIGLASIASTAFASVVTLLLLVPYGAVIVTTMPTSAPAMGGTADTAREIGARTLAGTIAVVGGVWSFAASCLWFGAALGALSGLSLLD